MFILLQVPYIALYIIAILLTAMTDSNPGPTVEKWYLFIPVVALVAIVSGWRRHADASNQARIGFLIREVLHWSALALVMYFLFRPDIQHFLNAESHGFVAIYLLGLTAMLSGLRSDWKIAVFGLFVILSGVTIAWFEDNALLIVGSFAAVGILATLIVGLVLYSKKNKSAAQAV